MFIRFRYNGRVYASTAPHNEDDRLYMLGKAAAFLGVSVEKIEDYLNG